MHMYYHNEYVCVCIYIYREREMFMIIAIIPRASSARTRLGCLDLRVVNLSYCVVLYRIVLIEITLDPGDSLVGAVFSLREPGRVAATPVCIYMCMYM